MRRLPALVTAALAPALTLTACDNIFGIDNYDEPNAMLTGQVVYNGNAIGVRSGGVELELWEPGFENRTKIPVHVDQDGSFSAQLFDGSYEINLLGGNGPWLDNSESISFDVRGDTELDVEVTPYYTIEDPTVTNNDGTIETTFRIGQVETRRNVEYVGVYVGTTTLVDRSNMAVRTEVSRSDIGSLDGGVSVSVELPESIWEKPEPGAREHVFVRIGVKTVGVAEMLFSPVEKVEI